MNTDKFDFFPWTMADCCNKYTQPKPYKTAGATGGGAYPEKDVKTTGIKMKGAGAAIKGTISRGPMA